jgi:hypothetical protein
VVPNGNHFPICDAPEDVATWIREFQNDEASLAGPATG